MSRKQSPLSDLHIILAFSTYHQHIRLTSHTLYNINNNNNNKYFIRINCTEIHSTVQLVHVHTFVHVHTLCDDQRIITVYIYYSINFR